MQSTGTGGPLPIGADAVVQIEDTEQLSPSQNGNRRVKLLKVVHSFKCFEPSACSLSRCVVSSFFYVQLQHCNSENQHTCSMMAHTGHPACTGCTVTESCCWQAAKGPEHDVRAVGSDIKAGQIVLQKGTLLGAAEIGILATVGASEVQVSPVCPAHGIVHRHVCPASTSSQGCSTIFH